MCYKHLQFSEISINIVFYNYIGCTLHNTNVHRSNLTAVNVVTYANLVTFLCIRHMDKINEGEKEVK